MKKKISLTPLKVQSFTTLLDHKKQREIKAGIITGELTCISSDIIVCGCDTRYDCSRPCTI